MTQRQPGLSIGFHCSHEQHAPSALIRLVRRAEDAGFRAAMCSDHFHPWSERQGHSGFTWSWLGAALEATGLSYGTVCAPGQRYHPAIVAQATATLAEMYEGRFWLAVGSGEALNEAVTGTGWPPRAERQARLKECVEIMRALWNGETVTHVGHVRVRDAKLYTRPARPPMLIGAALTVDTARWVGGWADGMITVAGSREGMRQRVEAFREGGGAGKPLFLQVALACGDTDAASADEACDQWGQCALTAAQLADLATPRDFDRVTSSVDRGDVLRTIRVSAEIGRHIEWLRADAALGFSRIYLHNVVRNQDRFLGACGERLLPELSRMQVADAHVG